MYIIHTALFLFFSILILGVAGRPCFQKSHAKYLFVNTVFLKLFMGKQKPDRAIHHTDTMLVNKSFLCWGKQKETRQGNTPPGRNAFIHICIHVHPYVSICMHMYAYCTKNVYIYIYIDKC